jgi:hypothetical protein
MKIFGRSHIVRTFAQAAVLTLLLFHWGSDSRAWPQNQTVGYAGALPNTASANELTNEFQLGKPAQREGLLRRLGVNSAVAHAASAAVVGSAIKVDTLHGTGANLLFLPCESSGVPTAHLFLLLPTTRQGSRVSVDQPLDCWWHAATYQLLSIAGDPQEMVLAQHVNYGHGSGYAQDDMWLFEVHGERLTPVLKTQEYKYDQIAGTDESVEEMSTLQPFPDGSIEETRATTLHEMIGKVGGGTDQMVERVHLEKIERRRWRRRGPSENFVPDDFVAVIPGGRQVD